MNIRKATIADYDGVWHIFKAVVKTGDTYVFDPDTPKKDLKIHWFAPYMHTYVSEEDGNILGTYIIKPNYTGRGAHIANASYMVHPDAQGRGIGRGLCVHSLVQAQNLGFHAMLFNSVVSTNTAAVRLWKKFGFRIIGMVPEAFRHQELGLVAVHIMYKKLATPLSVPD
ncbi:MAG: GNAT family N-acetyltransferase [Bacteroidota bacterium]